MRDSTLTRRGALSCIGIGVLLTVSEAFGFSQMSADRGLNATTSDDSTALLGIDGIDDPSVTPQFTNNTDTEMEITLESPDGVEFDVGDNGNWTAPPVNYPLSSTESEDVNIRFSGDCPDAETATVDTTADLIDDSGSDIGTISLTREFEISQAGQIQFDGTVDSAGASGKYYFEIENTGCDDVTFTGIGINETTTDADYVSGNGSLYDDDTGEMLVEPEIPIDSSDPTSDTRRDMVPTTLAVNETINFEFDSFERSGNGNNKIDMRGEDVRVTLYFGDDSSATIDLCVNECSF